jgi:hypothetical protein
MALLIQALMFHSSHYLWKSYEGGRITTLTKIVLGRVPPEAQREETAKTISTFYLLTMGTNDNYAIFFLFCQTLPLLNLGIQMYALNAFFKGTFTGLGVDAVATAIFEQAGRAMTSRFPRSTKCVMVVYEIKGHRVPRYAHCVLVQNTLNELVYAVTWFLCCALLGIITLLDCTCLHSCEPGSKASLSTETNEVR